MHTHFFAPFAFCTFVLAGRDFFSLALETERDAASEHGPKRKEKRKGKIKKKKRKKMKPNVDYVRLVDAMADAVRELNRGSDALDVGSASAALGALRDALAVADAELTMRTATLATEIAEHAQCRAQLADERTALAALEAEFLSTRQTLDERTKQRAEEIAEHAKCRQELTLCTAMLTAEMSGHAQCRSQLADEKSARAAKEAELCAAIESMQQQLAEWTASMERTRAELRDALPAEIPQLPAEAPAELPQGDGPISWGTVTAVTSASVSWYDAFHVVGDELLDAKTNASYGTGAWVSTVAYAARVATWDDRWLVAQFAAGTVKSAFFYDDAYVPTAASIIALSFTQRELPWTGNLPAAASFEHTLVVGSPVVLDFAFSPPLTGTALPASLAATLNGEPLSLESASFALCSTGACGASVGTIRMPFTALEATEHVFELSTLERTSRFVVPAAAVFTYPTVVTTARSPATLGQSVRLTTGFSSAFPASATATVVVAPYGTPNGQSATATLATVSGATVFSDHTVTVDAAHHGAFTVAYGPTVRTFMWGTGALTEGDIYTFPSTFSYDGSANGLGRVTRGYKQGPQIALRQSTACSLELTFAGGDGLHSSAVDSQVAYVAYVQGGVETPIPPSALLCTLPSKLTITSMTVAQTTSVTLKVRLRGPDGFVGDEMAVLIPSEQIASSAANVYFVDDYPRQIVGDGTYAWSIKGEPTPGIWLTGGGRAPTGNPAHYYAAFFREWGNTLVARFNDDFTGKSAWAIEASMESRTVENIDELLSKRGISFTWTGNLRGAGDAGPVSGPTAGPVSRTGSGPTDGPIATGPHIEEAD